MVKSDLSRGPNGLIKEGAKLVESAADVIDELLPQLRETFAARLRTRSASAPHSRERFGNDETLVYDALTCEPQSVDLLIRKTGLTASRVAAALLALELKKHVRPLPGNDYLKL
jgi:DNA processing protein